MKSHDADDDNRYSLNRRAALKAAGIASLGLLGGTTAFSGSAVASSPTTVKVVSDTDTQVVGYRAGNEGVGDTNCFDGMDEPADLTWVHESWNPETEFDADARWIWHCRDESSKQTVDKVYDTDEDDSTHFVLEPVNGDAVKFEKTFFAPENVGDATLYITADNGYEVEINDDFIGRSQDEEGNDNVSDDDDIPFYCTDLTEEFVSGERGTWDEVEAWNIADELIEGEENTLTVKAVNEQMDEATVESNPGGLIFEVEMEDVSAKISGVKFRDLEESGDPDGQELLGGWTINLYAEDPRDSDSTPVKSVSTDSDGGYSFEDLEPGDYWVGEELVDDWIQTYPDTEDGIHSVPLGAGDELTANFGNVQINPGDPRTIGFWRNWSESTNGNQPDILGKTLGDGISLGEYFTLTEDNTEDAVNILSKRDLDGNNEPGDKAYGLAAQLLAAKLNVKGVPEGTEHGPDPAAALGPIEDECEFDQLDPEDINDVGDLIDESEALLSSIEFRGEGPYLAPSRGGRGPHASGNDDEGRKLATELAECLDKFNNAELYYQAV